MKKLMALPLILALVVIPTLALVGCGNNDEKPNETWHPALNTALFREQRAPSLAFYRLGSAHRETEAGELGHFGTQAANAVSINNTTHTITVNTSRYATQVATNVRNMFPDFAKLTTLRIRTAQVGEVAAGNWVNLRTTAGTTTTTHEHFHDYNVNGRGNDNGWVTTGNHTPAYFVVGTPVAGDNRLIEVNGTYDGDEWTFFLRINRAAA